MSWILVSWWLVAGWVPFQGEQLAGVVEIADPARTNTVIALGLEAEILERLSLYGEVENYQFVDALGAYDPYRVEYTIGADLTLTSAITLSASHVCRHPVDGNTPTTYEGSETRVTVRIEGQTRF